MSEVRTSICCDARPEGELFPTEIKPGVIVWTGRCSKCKEGSEFWTDEEWNEFEQSFSTYSSYDEGMHMGGDSYNDAMHGAGDELQHEGDE